MSEVEIRYVLTTKGAQTIFQILFSQLGLQQRFLSLAIIQNLMKTFSERSPVFQTFTYQAAGRAMNPLAVGSRELTGDKLL